MYGVHDVDTSAIKMLKTVLSELRLGKGRATAGGGSIEVVVAGCKGPVRDILSKGGIINSVADDGGMSPGLSFSVRTTDVLPTLFEGYLKRLQGSVSSDTSTEAEWAEAMAHVEATGKNSLCHQFVLLKTAVRFAEWRVSTLGNTVVLPDGQRITIQPETLEKPGQGAAAGLRPDGDSTPEAIWQEWLRR